MKRSLLAWGIVLLLALPLTACNGDDSTGAAAKPAASEETSGSASESPSDEATEEATIGGLSETPTEDTSSGAALDGCSVVTEELLDADLGFAPGLQMLSQPSSFGDPHATDCYYSGGSGDLIVVKATTRPDTDMPEDSYGYGALPGAEAIPDVDWGWIYVLSPSPVVASVVFTVEGAGLDMAISTSSDVTAEQFQAFAADVVAALPG